MGKVRMLQRALEDANAHNAHLQHELAQTRTHAWTLQMVTAAILEKLRRTGVLDGASIVLSMPERREALEKGWGIETSVLPDDSKPMIVRLVTDVETPPLAEGDPL